MKIVSQKQISVIVEFRQMSNDALFKKRRKNANEHMQKL